MKAKVLIVDDASFMRGSLKFIVENAGYEVVGTAKNNIEAIELFKKFNPDVVTLDILMKDADGLAVLKEVKKENPKTKVIMVSALGQDKKQEEAFKLGASGYIRKPFNPDEIINEIKKVLNKDKQ